VDPTGKFLYANLYAYLFGAVAGFAINPISGALTPVPGSPFASASYLSPITIDPKSKFAYIEAVVGGNGNILGFAIDPATGSLAPVPGTPSSGGSLFPVTVDTTGKFAYVPEPSGDVLAFTIDSTTGTLTPIPGSPFPAAVAISVTIDPASKFAYAVDNSCGFPADGAVTGFTINGLSGALTQIGSPFPAGGCPQSMTMHPTGRFVYVVTVQPPSIIGYAINGTSGALSPVPGSPFQGGSGFFPLTIDSSGRFAYITNGTPPVFGDTSGVSAFAIDPITGTLTPVLGSPFPTGINPQSVTLTPGPAGQAPPPTTLTVASTNASSGVAIAVSPSDNNGQGNGTTQFTRTYNNGIAVTLGAPAIVGGNNFFNWIGCDSVSVATCTVTMNADRTVIANYVTPPPPILPDLTITSVRPVQVVYDVDLVLGKNVAFEVTVHVDNREALPLSPIPIELVFEGVSYPQTITKKDFGFTHTTGFEAIVYVNPAPRISPSSVGPHSVIARVNLDSLISIPESNRNNNELVSTVQVKQGVSLNLLFVPIPTCSLPPCPYGPLQEQPQTTVDEGSKFVRATYPLSEEGLSPKLSRNSYAGSPLALLGMALDIRRIGTWARLEAPNSKQKAIGIVPQNYFEYHVPFLPGTLGMTFYGCCNAALVVEGAWTAVAHELGHLEGLQVRPEKEEYELNPNGIGNPTTGFWVDGNLPISFAYCFMGTEEIHEKLESLSRWVDAPHYTQLFANLPTKDPEVLLLTALLHKDGTVDLGPLYDIPNGLATEALPGDYAVRVLNASGQILAQTTFPVSFTMQAEPHGAQPVDVVPLVITVPYSKTAAAIEILRTGQILTRVSPISKTLADAIEAIPDFGFVRDPEELRAALLNKAKAIDKMLSVGANNGAYHAIFHDLRPKIQLWLVDGYTKTAPDQLEKSEVLFVIDGVLNRILNLQN